MASSAETACSQGASGELTGWFAREVQPHEADLRSFIRRQFPTVHDADDIVQESLVRVWRAGEKGRIACARAYLFTTARSLACALFRRPRLLETPAVTSDTLARVVDERADVVKDICADEEFSLLLAAVETLPARCREIFLLRKIDGVSQSEIAQRLGLSEETIKAQVAKGAKRCSQFLYDKGVRRAPAGSSHVDA